MKVRAEHIVFLIFFSITLFVWQTFSGSVRTTDSLRNMAAAEKMKTLAAFRMDEYVAIMRAMQGLYASSTGVTRDEFRTFIYASGLDTQYQGVRSFTYVQKVRKSELPGFINALTRELTVGGNENYLSTTVYADKESYLLNNYIVPMHEETPHTFGAEADADPVIAQAMTAAEKSGELTASGTVGSGFMLVMPVFTASHLSGYVIMQLDYTQLAQAVVDTAGASSITMKATDSAGQTLFTTGTEGDSSRNIWTTPLIIAGREWTLTFAAKPASQTDYEHRMPWYILGGGTVMSLLIYSVIAGMRREAIKNDELVKGQATLTSSIESFPRGFVITDPQGKFVLHNGVLAKILKSKEVAWTLEKLEDEFGKDYDLVGAIKKCLSDKKPIDSPEFLRGNQWLKVYVAPNYLQGAGSDVIGAMITVDDITEAKALTRSRDEFFSIASHELRTPLTTIRGNADMLSDYYGDKVKDPDFREMVSDISESSTRLIEIVNDFLNMGRLEQGKMNFALAPIDLSQLIAEAVSEYTDTAKRRKIALHWVKPTTELPLVKADPDRVRQVLVNLIGNAVKFTDEGSVTISAEMKEGKVGVTVADTGRGILPANQGLLFRKFQQAGTSLLTRDTTKGTGLGLYISKLIIEGMGGDIKLVDSRPNKGSVFAFTLPIARRNS